jgi:hypothetical protein
MLSIHQLMTAIICACRLLQLINSLKQQRPSQSHRSSALATRHHCRIRAARAARVGKNCCSAISRASTHGIVLRCADACARNDPGRRSGLNLWRRVNLNRRFKGSGSARAAQPAPIRRLPQTSQMQPAAISSTSKNQSCPPRLSPADGLSYLGRYCQIWLSIHIRNSILCLDAAPAAPASGWRNRLRCGLAARRDE